MVAQDDEEHGLEDLLPENVWEDPRCYTSHYYHEWEREVATPALEALGYMVGLWWTTDGDSFGPLVRCVELTKDGKKELWYYG